MPSSTFSSEHQLPVSPWLPLVLAALLATGVLAGLLEIHLAGLGYQPTVNDSAARWIAQRARASALGEKALILVGASRFQVGLDLDVLRQETGLEPVQLAIDGNAGGPVLEHLVDDPTIRGTILFDYYGQALGSSPGAEKMIQRYNEAGSWSDGFAQPFMHAENLLTRWLHEKLRIYADRTNPLYALRFRAMPNQPSRQYLSMHADRSRSADYSRTPMPENYYRRVARTLGENIAPDTPGIEATLQARIAKIGKEDTAQVGQAVRTLATMAATLHARGGRLALVAMPTSGMVRDIETRRYPQEHFWNHFALTPGIIAIHAVQDPVFGEYHCPDGSHLDIRDRARFSRELAWALRQHGIGWPQGAANGKPE